MCTEVEELRMEIFCLRVGRKVPEPKSQSGLVEFSDTGMTTTHGGRRPKLCNERDMNAGIEMVGDCFGRRSVLAAMRLCYDLNLLRATFQRERLAILDAHRVEITQWYVYPGWKPFRHAPVRYGERVGLVLGKTDKCQMT